MSHILFQSRRAHLVLAALFAVFLLIPALGHTVPAIQGSVAVAAPSLGGNCWAAPSDCWAFQQTCNSSFVRKDNGIGASTAGVPAGVPGTTRQLKWTAGALGNQFTKAAVIIWNSACDQVGGVALNPGIPYNTNYPLAFPSTAKWMAFLPQQGAQVIWTVT